MRLRPVKSARHRVSSTCCDFSAECAGSPSWQPPLRRMEILTPQPRSAPDFDPRSDVPPRYRWPAPAWGSGCRADMPPASRLRAPRPECLQSMMTNRRRAMKVTRVQYTVQQGFVEQNKKNIEAVMRELSATGNRDVQYAVYLQDDGKTFMHVVHYSATGAADLPAS